MVLEPESLYLSVDEAQNSCGSLGNGCGSLPMRMAGRSHRRTPVALAESTSVPIFSDTFAGSLKLLTGAAIEAVQVPLSPLVLSAGDEHAPCHNDRAAASPIRQRRFPLHVDIGTPLDGKVRIAGRLSVAARTPKRRPVASHRMGNEQGQDGRNRPRRVHGGLRHENHDKWSLIHNSVAGIAIARL